MRFFTLFFLAGISISLFLSHLPNVYWAIGILLSGSTLLIFFRNRKYYFFQLIIIVSLGFAWLTLHADQLLAVKLPLNLASQSLVITGTINSIPEVKTNYSTFIIAVHTIPTANIKYSDPLLVRLAWEFAPKLHVGDLWQLNVKLKPPRGFWNIASYDYQQWLFEQRVRATGYVVANSNNLLLGNAEIIYSVDAYRQRLAEHINTQLQNYPLAGLVAALAVGVRNNVTEQQWLVLRNTGTNHLFAIAGLHIGILTAIVFCVVNFLWRFSGNITLYFPAQQSAAIAALCAAILYSALAGFALPTQRASVMVTVFLFSILFRRNLASWSAWSLALLVILITEPLAILSDSFWLSFGAVGLILYGVSGRVAQTGLWWHWGRAQWVMTIGLIPLGILFFQQTALVGLLANIIAVPWVGFIVLPLVLLGDIFWIFAPKLSGFCWWLAEYALQGLWPILNHLAALDTLQWYGSIANQWILLTAFIGVILFLLPNGIALRSVGIVWLLPLFFWKPNGPMLGEVWFTLLDAGEGLAAIIRTQNHVLVFNLDNAVVPYLKAYGISTVDTLMLDKDEDAENIENILTGVAVKQYLTNTYFGQHWQWDNVNFQVLYPTQTNIPNTSFSKVLRIETGTQSILLTGDTDHLAETELLTLATKSLASNILIAPHHGSNTSSTPEFIAAVHPNFVLFSAGYLNRYAFPDAQVVARYQASGAQIFSTAEVGMIVFKLTGTGNINLPSTYLKNDWHFWDN